MVQEEVPSLGRVSAWATFESGVEFALVPESFNEALRLLELFPKPRSSSSSSSCVVRVAERLGTLDAGIVGIGGTSTNDTKSDGEDDRSLGNIVTTGVVLESSALEESHHPPPWESLSGNSFSSG